MKTPPRRSRLIDRAIALTTIAGHRCDVRRPPVVLALSLPVALLFLAAMRCFIIGFGSFLREVLLATAPLRAEAQR